MLYYFVFFNFLLGFSQGVYELNPKYPVHDLQEYLQIIEDSENNLRSEMLLEDHSYQVLSDEKKSKRLDVGKIYWGKLKLRITEPLEGWTLQFEDKMIGPPAWTKSNGKVDVYAYQGDRLLFHKKTGVEYSKKERDVKGHWVLNQVSISDLPVQTEITLIIKAQGNSIGYPAYFNLSARSPDKANYHEIFQLNRSFNIFMFGITFIILLYHLLQYIYLKERVMLWFSVWLLFITLAHAMTIGLIIGSFTKLRYSVFVLITNGVFYSFWFFGRAFIDSKIKFPKLDKLMIGLAFFVLIESIAVAFYVPVFDVQTSYTGVGIHYILLNVYSLLSLATSIIIVLQKDKFAQYFGVGSIIVAIFFFVGTLWSLGIITVSRNLPDPYATGMFLQIIIYSFGIAYRRQVINKQVQQDKLEAQKTYVEMQRIKDLDEIKTRFFANISHEFRTPLSLISGPLNQAQKTTNNSDSFTISSKVYKMITKNVGRLQNLIDQLLELSRIESGSVHINLTQGGLVRFIKSIIYSFESMAERKNISLNTSFPKEIDGAFFDKDKLEKILVNLLSNAFKYTPSGGAVTVVVDHDPDYFVIEISDTGKGMNTEEIKRIFERFYRVEGSEEKGSGIGLALTKEMIDLLNGQISVSSRKGQGTSFKVRIPHSLEFIPKNNVIMPESKQIEYSESTIDDFLHIENGKEDQGKILTQHSNKPIVLVVEDNHDLREFITEILEDQYNVISAINGLQGERMALEHIPDVVVTDVMMPEKDGYQLSHSLKTNNKTSHIPIVMLTAKAGHDNKMEGLTQGADAYLTKPFNSDELLLRLRNLIDRKRKIWEHFKNLDLNLIDDLDVSSVDDQFLQKVVSVIRDNLDNELLSVEDLAAEVGFSRSQLHRKLKALTNKSANQLIVEIRLNEAKRMLETKVGSVSEIAYSVGYSNMSYFTKSFKEKFGMLPSKV